MTKTILSAALLSVAMPLLAMPATAQQAAPAGPASLQADSIESLAPAISGYFEDYMRSQNIPGLVFGVVKDGKLVMLRTLGVQDTASSTAVTADSRFRIASMSKAFTAFGILALRDAGKLSLQDPAEKYVPEMKGWKYPTKDSPKITVADLIHHTAGFVEDNPWGDRQQALSEADFTKMIKDGVAFAQAPGTRMEYSNYGYALLGRIIRNVTGMPYQDWMRDNLFKPLGMQATGYDVFASPQSARALGYRWQDEAWVREPDMADGTFGAMGGMETTANDYWRWVSYLLSGWPARDDSEAGPAKRSTIREIVEGANFAGARQRPAILGAPCRVTSAYAKGWNVVEDCDLGRYLQHGGGYPGYGSTVILMPDAGVGIFAFANRTYAGPQLPALQALIAMRNAGLAADRSVPVDAGLAEAYSHAKAIWTKGDPEAAPLGMNIPLDRDIARRKADIAAVKAKVGTCTTDGAIRPISAMEGLFTWPCTNGKVEGRVQRTPETKVRIQAIGFRAGE